jgi:hypothetical protein
LNKFSKYDDRFSSNKAFVGQAPAGLWLAGGCPTYERIIPDADFEECGRGNLYFNKFAKYGLSDSNSAWCSRTVTPHLVDHQPQYIHCASPVQESGNDHMRLSKTDGGIHPTFPI